MPVTGQLTDLSLAELFEFFCNQRKSGRLEVTCPNGSGNFYLDSGSIVHAQIGILSGIEAVHYALSLPRASVSFSPGVNSPEQTITQSWQSVVLEGLRLIDEGIAMPPAFPETPVDNIEVFELTEEQVTNRVVAISLPESIYAELEGLKLAGHGAFDEYVHPPAQAQELDEVESSGPSPPQRATVEEIAAAEAFAEPASEQGAIVEAIDSDSSTHDPDRLIDPLRELSTKANKPLPDDGFVVPSFLSEVEVSRSIYGPWKLATVLTAIILVLAAVAVPWGWHARNKAAKAASVEAPQAASSNAPAESNGVQPANSANGSSDTSEAGKKSDELHREPGADQNKPNQ